MSGEIDLREYGRLEAEVAQLKIAVATMQADVKAMRDLMEQSRGGWRTLVYLGGVASTLGAFVSWALHNLHFKS